MYLYLERSLVTSRFTKIIVDNRIIIIKCIGIESVKTLCDKDTLDSLSLLTLCCLEVDLAIGYNKHSIAIDIVSDKQITIFDDNSIRFCHIAKISDSDLGSLVFAVKNINLFAWYFGDRSITRLTLHLRTHIVLDSEFEIFIDKFFSDICQIGRIGKGSNRSGITLEHSKDICTYIIKSIKIVQITIKCGRNSGSLLDHVWFGDHKIVLTNSVVWLHLKCITTSIVVASTHIVLDLCEFHLVFSIVCKLESVRWCQV